MSRFQLDDVVRGSYEDIKVIGLTITISDGRAALLEFNADKTGYWARNFPDWLEKPVYRIWLPKAIKSVSYQDYMEHYGVTNTASVRKMYEQIVDDIRVFSFCEDELSLVAEAGSDRSTGIKEMLAEELVKAKLQL
jgi:hypothetical protein